MLILTKKCIGCCLLIESTAVVDDENPVDPNKLSQPGRGQPVDVSSLKRDLFANMGVSEDASFEKKLLQVRPNTCVYRS